MFGFFLYERRSVSVLFRARASRRVQARLFSAGKPAGDPTRAALPVAGDDAQAKDVVIALLDELGFDGVDAGPAPTAFEAVTVNV